MKALIVTGEASGDLYGGGLAAAFRARHPSISMAGMGGQKMQEAGVQLLYHYNQVAVVGVFEVFGKLQHLRAAYRNLRHWIDLEKPDFAVLIDFPDFNFRIARLLKSRGVKTFYFISPQLWAWRKGRINFLRDHVRLMLCILPFEKAIYEAARVPVEYVGHPLVEMVRDGLSHQPEIPRGTGLRLGLMPGSREVEVRRHLPVLLETLNRIRKSADVEALLMWPPWLPAPEGIAERIQCVREDRYAAMSSCDLMLVASGTSTLESAILGVPLLIVYRVSSISWLLGKALVRVPYYGLVNWIAGKKVIPEFIQDEMNPATLAEAALQYLNDAALRTKMRDQLRRIVNSLGPPGALDRAATAILSCL